MARVRDLDEPGSGMACCAFRPSSGELPSFAFTSAGAQALPMAVRSRWPMISSVGTLTSPNSSRTGCVNTMSVVSAAVMAMRSRSGPLIHPIGISTSASYSGFHAPAK